VSSILTWTIFLSFSSKIKVKTLGLLKEKIDCGCDIFPLSGGLILTTITYALNPNHFSKEEESFFRESEESFRRAGFSVKRVPLSLNPTAVIFLTTHKEMARLYPFLPQSPGLSLTDRSKTPMHVHLHLENWLTVPRHIGSNFTELNDYRVALISHELAHVLGYDHVGCACEGCPRDTRQQPSRDSGGCNVHHKEVVINPKSPFSSVNF
jgi:hypothetical protein